MDRKKKTGVAILISDKIDFKKRAIKRDPDGQPWCLSDSQGPAKGPSFQSFEDKGVTPQNTDLFSTPLSLAEQLLRTKAASPVTWQTSAVLPHELIASLRYPQVYLERSFENKWRSGYRSMRLE